MCADMLQKLKSKFKSRQDDHVPRARSESAISNARPTLENQEADKDNDESKHFKDKICVIVVGAGCRGNTYAQYAIDFPERLKIVAVAEPNDKRRQKFQHVYELDESNCYKDWKEIVEQEKFADAVLITTQDSLHKEPAIAFSNKGYHILLEKPMAPTLQDCKEIVHVCQKNGTIFVVCHVLRYHPHYLKVNELIQNGVIGDVVHVQHMEPVGWNHFAHSFVRGNWRREDESGFSLLTKSCHDLDLMHSFMQGSKCLRVSSFGSLSHFTNAAKPKNAGSCCLDCEVEPSCPYSAYKIYMKPVKSGFPSYFSAIACDTMDVEEMEQALRTGPYGRCVYDCDNDVMSNQVVNMEYEGGKTVSFSMVAFTEKMCIRQTKIFGTLGEMECSEDKGISVFDFATEDRRSYTVTFRPRETTRLRGHSYADYYLMHAFVKAVANQSQSYSLTGSEETLESHRLVFLAEKSRVENRVVDLLNEDV